MKNKDLFKQKPKVEDYDCQPYGYINALQNYVNKLEEAINYSQCCTQLKACLQIGEKVILDNHTEVEVLVAEPKLYIRQNEYDSEMWVNMKRLKKKSL